MSRRAPRQRRRSASRVRVLATPRADAAARPTSSCLQQFASRQSSYNLPELCCSLLCSMRPRLSHASIQLTACACCVITPTSVQGAPAAGAASSSARMREMSGSRNVSVLPEPVSAMPMMSRPAHSTGQLCTVNEQGRGVGMKLSKHGMVLNRHGTHHDTFRNGHEGGARKKRNGKTKEKRT